VAGRILRFSNPAPSCRREQGLAGGVKMLDLPARSGSWRAQALPDTPKQSRMSRQGDRRGTIPAFVITALCLGLSAVEGCTQPSGAPTAMAPPQGLPQYPLCPSPFARRVGPGEVSIIESCGGFDESGKVIDGWEVTSYSNGIRREEHKAKGKLQGYMRVWFEDGDSWIGWYEDGLLEGRREYWHANGGKWQEADFHRGEIRGPGRAWFPDGTVQSLFIGGSDKPYPHLEWHEDGTFYRQEGNVQLILGGKTREEVREANRRPPYGPLPRALPEGPTGPLGSKTNPVRCDGPEGERAYLRRLRCDGAGQPAQFERLGSVGIGVYGNVLDEYEVTCGGESRSVFLDMYHDNHVEKAPPPGFTIH